MFIVIIILLVVAGLFVFSVFKLKSPPPLTEAEQRQALIDSTTAPATATPISEKEKRALIDSTTAPKPKTTFNNK